MVPSREPGPGKVFVSLLPCIEAAIMTLLSANLPSCNSASLKLIGATAIAVAVTLSGGAGAAPDNFPVSSAQRHERSVCNEYGAPVIDAQGRRVFYAREELERQKAAWKSSRPARGSEDPDATAGVSGDTGSSNTSVIWTCPMFQPGMGSSDLVAADNGRGQIEIYTGMGYSNSGNSYWSAIAWDPVLQVYQPVYTSSFCTAGIYRIAVGDVTGDDRKEILVATGNGDVLLYDQATKAAVGKVATGKGITGLGVANLYGHAKQEMLICTGSELAVYYDGVLQWSAAGTGGGDPAVAQMDNDPAMEIALTSGKIVDADSHSVQWDVGHTFVNVGALDFDGDGKAEMVGAQSWSFLWAFDVDTQLPKWSYSAFNLDALRVADVDGDGKSEIILGDAQWGNVYALDPATQTVKWSIANPEHGVSDVAVADVDGDGQNEVVWCGGYSSSGQDVLFVGNFQTHAIEWRTGDLNGPFIGPEVGDLDGDGVNEVVVASYEAASGYDSGRILVFDGRTLKLRGMSNPVMGNRSWTGLHDLKLRDVNGDGKQEIIIAADWLYDGAVEIYSFNSSNAFTVLWTNATRPSGSPFYTVDFGDMTGAGNCAIVAGCGQAHSGSPGIFVYMYDYTTKSELWHSFSLGGSWCSSLAVADIDSTPGLEIVAGINGGNAYVFDAATRSAKAMISGAFTKATTRGRNLYFQESGGKIDRYLFEAGSYLLKSQVQPVSGAFDGMTIENDDPFAAWIGQGGYLNACETTTVLSRSGNYGSSYGSRVRNGITAGAYCVTANWLPVPYVAPEPATTPGTTNTITWSRVAGGDSYLVEASLNPDFANAAFRSDWMTSFSCTVAMLSPGQLYYYRAKCRTADGAVESGWSTPVASRQEGSSYIPVVVDTFEISAGGMMPFGTTKLAGYDPDADGGNAPLSQDLQLTDYDAASGALRVWVGSAPAGAATSERYRIIGWKETGRDEDPNSSELKYAAVGSGNWIRAKFHVFATGQAMASNPHQIPNMRLRVTANGYAFASVLDLEHHLSGTDASLDVIARDMAPSRDPAHPTVYRVDMDPPEIPMLVNDAANQGFERAFEAYAKASEPQENGYLCLTESSIGVYPVPEGGTVVKTYGAPEWMAGVGTGAGRAYTLAAEYGYSADFPVLSARVNENESISGYPVTTSESISFAGDAAGFSLSTVGVDQQGERVGVASADWVSGTVADANPALRARVQADRQYRVRFHLTSSVPASQNAQIRLRCSSVSFQYSPRLEVGGSQGGGDRARQYLPGVGTGWESGNYDLVFVTPFQINPAAMNLTQIGHLGGQPGTGVARASYRDLHPGIDLIDELVQPLNAQGQVTVDAIAIEEFPLLMD